MDVEKARKVFSLWIVTTQLITLFNGNDIQVLKSFTHEIISDKN